MAKQTSIPASDPTEEILKLMGEIGREEKTLKFINTEYTIRSLTPADEIYVYDRAGNEATSELGRLQLIRIYMTCLMISKIDGKSIDELIFGKERDPLNRDRQIICNTLSELFGTKWDRRAFRLFFKYIWAWSETHLMEIVNDIGVENFLTPEELKVYRDLKLAEEIESASGSIASVAEAEKRLDAVESTLPAESVTPDQAEKAN